MRILDEDGNEIFDPDLSIGYLNGETIIIAHHDATEYVAPITHYEVVAEYPNGGKDVVEVVDVEGVPAKDAWDETEEILRYIRFTEEEMEEMERQRREEEDMKEAVKILNVLLGVTE